MIADAIRCTVVRVHCAADSLAPMSAARAMVDANIQPRRTV